MALIKSVRGYTPEIGNNCFLADNATLIGDVVLGNGCSIWFNCGFTGRRKFHSYREPGKYSRRIGTSHSLPKIDNRNRE